MWLSSRRLLDRSRTRMDGHASSPCRSSAVFSRLCDICSVDNPVSCSEGMMMVVKKVFKKTKMNAKHHISLMGGITLESRAELNGTQSDITAHRVPRWRRCCCCWGWACPTASMHQDSQWRWRSSSASTCASAVWDYDLRWLNQTVETNNKHILILTWNSDLIDTLKSFHEQTLYAHLNHSQAADADEGLQVFNGGNAVALQPQTLEPGVRVQVLNLGEAWVVCEHIMARYDGWFWTEKDVVRMKRKRQKTHEPMMHD